MHKMKQRRYFNGNKRAAALLVRTEVVSSRKSCGLPTKTKQGKTSAGEPVVTRRGNLFMRGRFGTSEGGGYERPMAPCKEDPSTLDRRQDNGIAPQNTKPTMMSLAATDQKQSSSLDVEGSRPSDSYCALDHDSKFSANGSDKDPRRTITTQQQLQQTVRNNSSVQPLPSTQPPTSLVGQPVSIAPTPIPVTTIVQDFFRKSTGNKRKALTQSFLQDCNLSRTQSQNSSSASAKLRSGKWIPEEEEYAKLLVELFFQGAPLDCEDGSSLRSYLARKLRCTPMRISKKFSGKGIGKSCYKRVGKLGKNSASRLLVLERQFHVATTKFPPGTFAMNLSPGRSSTAAKVAPPCKPLPSTIQVQPNTGFRLPTLPPQQGTWPTMALPAPPAPQFAGMAPQMQLLGPPNSGSQEMLFQPAAPLQGSISTKGFHLIPQMQGSQASGLVSAEQLNAAPLLMQQPQPVSYPVSANLPLSMEAGRPDGSNPYPLAQISNWGQLAIAAGSMATYAKAMLQASMVSPKASIVTPTANAFPVQKVEQASTGPSALPRVSLDLNTPYIRSAYPTERTQPKTTAEPDLLSAFDHAIMHQGKETIDDAIMASPSTDPLHMLTNPADDLHHYSSRDFDNIAEFSEDDANQALLSHNNEGCSILDFDYGIVSESASQGSKTSDETLQDTNDSNTTSNKKFRRI